MQKFFTFSGIALVVILGSVKLVLIIFTQGSFYAYTDPVDSPNDQPVAELTSIILGETEQHILMRGQDYQNPVLLWLHGGPGAAQMPFAHEFDGELEKHFVVVHWDQRGGGKSNPSAPGFNLTETITRLEVPVWFLNGRNDFNTPTELVREYYDALDAPLKRFMLFPHGHTPFFASPELFNSTLIEMKREVEEFYGGGREL